MDRWYEAVIETRRQRYPRLIPTIIAGKDPGEMEKHSKGCIFRAEGKLKRLESSSVPANFLKTGEN